MYSIYDKIVMKIYKRYVWNKRNLYMNFRIKDGYGLEFTVYEGQMMTEVALTSFTLYEAYSSFVTNSVTHRIFNTN